MHIMQLPRCVPTSVTVWVCMNVAQCILVLVKSERLCFSSVTQKQLISAPKRETLYSEGFEIDSR